MKCRLQCLCLIDFCIRIWWVCLDAMKCSPSFCYWQWLPLNWEDRVVSLLECLLKRWYFLWVWLRLETIGFSLSSACDFVTQVFLFQEDKGSVSGGFLVFHCFSGLGYLLKDLRVWNQCAPCVPACTELLCILLRLGAFLWRNWGCLK